MHAIAPEHRAISRKPEYVVIDVETTGPDASCARVVEVAAIRYHGREGVGEFQRLVNPGIPIPPETSAIHHITDRDVADAPPIEIVWQALTDFAGPDALCVAHNAEFDRSFVTPLRDRTWLCTLRFARHLWPDAPNHKNQTLRYWLGLEIPFVGAHRALVDVDVTAQIFFRELETYRERRYEWDINAVAEYIKRPIPYSVMDFGKHKGLPLSAVPLDYLRWALTCERAKRNADLLHSLTREYEGRTHRDALA